MTVCKTQILEFRCSRMNIPPGLLCRRPYVSGPRCRHCHSSLMSTSKSKENQKPADLRMGFYLVELTDTIVVYIKIPALTQKGHISLMGKHLYPNKAHWGQDAKTTPLSKQRHLLWQPTNPGIRVTVGRGWFWIILPVTLHP